MVSLQNLTLIAPDDPGADDLYDGGTKINANNALFAASQVAHATAMPLTKFWTEFAETNLTSTTTYTVPADVLPGAKLVMHLTGPGPLRWPNANLVSLHGTYHDGWLNVVTVEILSGTTNLTARINVQIENHPLVALGLAFRQDVRSTSAGFSAGWLSSESELLSVNEGSGSPGSELKFSRLGSITPERDGYYYWQLQYFNGASSTGIAIFRQRSHIVYVPENYEAVEGYLGYSGTAGLILPVLNTPFGGLCRRANGLGAWVHGHPGELNALGAFRATMAVWDSAQSFPTSLPDPFDPPNTFDPRFAVPGYNSTDNIVELTALAMQQ